MPTPISTSDHVRTRWVSRTRAEHASAEVMETLADRFAMIVKDKPGIVLALRRAAADERRHATWCEQILERLNEPFKTAKQAPTLPLTESGVLRFALIEHVVFLLCAGEAIAAAMLAEARDGATAEGIAELLDAIATDEARHGALGWVVLDALLVGMSAGDLQLVAALVPRQAVRAVMAAGAVGPVGAEGEAWGLLGPERALAVAKGVMVQRIGPELQARGLWSRPR